MPRTVQYIDVGQLKNLLNEIIDELDDASVQVMTGEPDGPLMPVTSVEIVREGDQTYVLIRP